MSDLGVLIVIVALLSPLGLQYLVGFGAAIKFAAGAAVAGIVVAVADGMTSGGAWGWSILAIGVGAAAFSFWVAYREYRQGRPCRASKVNAPGG